MITFEDIINNIELQDKIIYTVFSLDFEKNVKNIVRYINKRYRLNLDESQKHKLSGIFSKRIMEMMTSGKVIKREKGYVLASIRINFSEIENEKDILNKNP
jgi:hypothetical protein